MDAPLVGKRPLGMRLPLSHQPRRETLGLAKSLDGLGVEHLLPSLQEGQIQLQASRQTRVPRAKMVPSAQQVPDLQEKAHVLFVRLGLRNKGSDTPGI